VIVGVALEIQFPDKYDTPARHALLRQGKERLYLAAALVPWP
jgi:hypothetical protein